MQYKLQSIYLAEVRCKQFPHCNHNMCMHPKALLQLVFINLYENRVQFREQTENLYHCACCSLVIRESVRFGFKSSLGRRSNDEFGFPLSL